MKTETKKRNKVSLALYIVAAVFGIYAIFAFINTSLYIANLISTQYITVSESISDIISYFATSSGSYIFYAIVLGCLAYLMNLHMPVKVKKEVEPESTLKETVVEAEVIEAEVVEAVEVSTDTAEKETEMPSIEAETIEATEVELLDNKNEEEKPETES